MKAFRILLMIVAMISVGLLVAAGAMAAPPGLPSVFYGSVDTMMDIDGAQVIALVDGVEYGSTEVRIDTSLGPVYLLNVLADDPDTSAIEGGQSGETVQFVLELESGRRLQVVQTGVWSGGTADELDLSPYSYLLLPLVTLTG